MWSIFMSKAKPKAAAANVVDLAAFRQTRSRPESQLASQDSSQEQPAPRWTYVDGALWCLTQNDSLPAIHDLLNDWEIGFLEDVAQLERSATPRQVRCLNRIILMINGMLAEMRMAEINGPSPAA
jgi:hypothetical protein